jgi:DNA repair exonuclease SbcCD ATPase subunit/ribosomal protein L40E
MAQRALTPGNAAHCSECGAETTPDAAACARCEQPFEGSIQAVFCPICNSLNPAESRECRNCSAKFPEAGAIPPPGPAPSEASPEEEYLRRILQLSRQKAKSRILEGVPEPESKAGSEPASLLEGGGEGDWEESLWKLSEPFDRMLERRKRRLEQMDTLIDRARSRIKGLEATHNPLEVRERDELKRQIEELLLEKEDILKLEEGLVNMENTYRNVLRMQQDELKARESSLRSRINAFRHELESREKTFGQLKERESDIVRREDDFRVLMNRVHERERDLEKREELLREKARLLDERHHGLSEAEVDLERKRWELQQKGSGKDPPKGESVYTVRSDSDLADLKGRMVQLEEQMERAVGERNELIEQQKELLGLRDDLKVVMKDLDELLGDLPADKIRDFAKSEKYTLYEKILERLEL